MINPTPTNVLRVVSLGLLAFAAACATPPVTAQGLALRKVVVYRNGVGYFERAGRIRSERVEFKVRKSEVGDFLASLAVLERGGSSVKSASFPVAVDDTQAPPRPPEPLDQKDAKGAAFSRPPADSLETVVMELDGDDHDLQVGYIASTPVWRPSYRLVIDKGEATLQAWGIVQNLSGEDWRDVRLSLVAEAPLAFEASLGKPIIPPRPEVTDGGDVIAVVPKSETSLGQQEERERAMSAPSEMAGAAPAPAPPPVAAKPRTKARKGGAPVMDEADETILRAAPAGPAVPLSGRTRNLSALAAVAVQTGATRYDIPNAVTVPDRSATMVMLLDKQVPGEAIALFAPDPGVPDSSRHPFRVARFTNRTGGLLERGPLAIFAEGAFLGQGMTDALPDGATATVPFAIERTLAVDTDREQTQQGARVYRIEAGALTVVRDAVTKSRYRVRNGADRASKVLLKHHRIAGARLVNPPKGTEDNVGAGTALVPAEIAARSTSTVLVDERQQSLQGLDWVSELADLAVKAYMADRRADPAAVAQLRAAWQAREALLRLVDEREKLRSEEANLRRANDETRANLKALEKNTAAGDLRAKLTSRLAADAAQLDRVVKRIIEVDLGLNEQRIRFTDAIRVVRVLEPLPEA